MSCSGQEVQMPDGFSFARMQQHIGCPYKSLGGGGAAAGPRSCEECGSAIDTRHPRYCRNCCTAPYVDSTVHEAGQPPRQERRRHCHMCGYLKPLDAFGGDGRDPASGRRSCSTCRSKSAEEWRTCSICSVGYQTPFTSKSALLNCDGCRTADSLQVPGMRDGVLGRVCNSGCGRLRLLTQFAGTGTKCSACTPVGRQRACQYARCGKTYTQLADSAAARRFCDGCRGAESLELPDGKLGRVCSDGCGHLKPLDEFGGCKKCQECRNKKRKQK